MTPMVQRYAQYVVNETKGDVLDPDHDTPFLSGEADEVVGQHIELLERRGMLWDLIRSSGEIDARLHENGEIDQWSNDPNVWVRRIAVMCLHQAVVDLMISSSVAS